MANTLGSLYNEAITQLDKDQAVHLMRETLLIYARLSTTPHSNRRLCLGFINDCKTAQNEALELATALVTGLQHNTWPWSG